MKFKSLDIFLRYLYKIWLLQQNRIFSICRCLRFKIMYLTHTFADTYRMIFKIRLLFRWWNFGCLEWVLNRSSPLRFSDPSVTLQMLLSTLPQEWSWPDRGTGRCTVMHCFCAFVLCTVHYVGGTYFVFLIEPKCKFLSALLQRNQLLMHKSWPLCSSPHWYLLCVALPFGVFFNTLSRMNHFLFSKRFIWFFWGFPLCCHEIVKFSSVYVCTPMLSVGSVPFICHYHSDLHAVGQGANCLWSCQGFAIWRLSAIPIFKVWS